MQGIVTGSYNFQKLAVSPDAIRAVYHAKMQLLLILIQSLNLESLLQMIRDNIPFRFCYFFPFFKCFIFCFPFKKVGSKSYLSCYCRNHLAEPFYGFDCLNHLID